MDYHYSVNATNYGYKKFSLLSGSFSSPVFSYPGYPSYLGATIFKLDSREMPRFVLGFTNGRQIAVRKALKGLLAEFVQLHEEEHVKDMYATEKEVDKRALQRLLARHPSLSGNELKAVKKLLHKRWQSLADFAIDNKNFFYRADAHEKGYIETYCLIGARI